MAEINVIVIPETEEYRDEVCEDLVIYISKGSGFPQLNERNVKYCVPFWLNDKKADRIYEIKDHYEYEKDTYVIELGVGFLLPKQWNKMEQTRKYEYQPLSSFGVKNEHGTVLVAL